LVGVEARRLQVLDPLRLRLHERFLARLDLRQVRSRAADLEPELARERVDRVYELGGDEVRLRRRAGDVGAAAAPAFVLDQRNAGPVLPRGAVRAVSRGRAGADRDQV